MRSTDHKAPRYVVFFTPLLPCRFLAQVSSLAPCSWTLSACGPPSVWKGKLHKRTKQQTKLSFGLRCSEFCEYDGCGVQMLLKQNIRTSVVPVGLECLSMCPRSENKTREPLNCKGKAFCFQAMKAYGGTGNISPLILKLGTTWRWVVNFTHQPLYFRGWSLVLVEWTAKRIFIKS